MRQESQKLTADAVGGYYFSDPLARSCVLSGLTERETILELLKDRERLTEYLSSLIKLVSPPLLVTNVGEDTNNEEGL